MPLDVQKFNVKGCYRILEHSIRYNGKDVNYSNMDIDKTRTSENYHMGIERNNAYGYLKDTVKKYDSIIPPKRIKKDRVILTGFCFTVPESIANTNREREYFEYCYKWLKKQFGEANIITADVHRDEIHKYWDNQKNVWTESRAHMHAEIIPYTQTKGVNCKNFMTKDKLKYWHEDLDQYIYKKMGIHDLVYSESKIVGRNTDMLKKESIEAQAKMVKDLNRQVNQIKLNEGNLEQREQSIISWQDEIEQREQSLSQLEEDINSREDITFQKEQELNQRIESADAEIQRQTARVQSAKQEADKQLQEQQKRTQEQLDAMQQEIDDRQSLLKEKQESYNKIRDKLNKEYDDLVDRNEQKDIELTERMNVLESIEQTIKDHAERSVKEFPSLAGITKEFTDALDDDVQQIYEQLDELER